MSTAPKPKSRSSTKRKPIAAAREIGKTGISATGPGEVPVAMKNGNLSEAAVSNEERHQLIAEAAYFRAQRRNFAPGNELEDWLAAEAEIEMKLSGIPFWGDPSDGNTLSRRR